MKKRVLLLATCFGEWKGGLYYVKNMLFALLQYEKSVKNLQIFILVDKENYEVFNSFENDYDNVVVILNRRTAMTEGLKKVRKIICTTIFHKPIVWDISSGIMEKYGIDVVFPLQKSDFFYDSKGISWIPDFQYIHYPEFFSTEELLIREQTNSEIAKNHKKLILSSHDAYRDFCNLYPNCKEGVYVVPFVSAIDMDFLSKCEDNEILKKYRVPRKFFIVSNQFWRHKNHETLFEAVRILKEEYYTPISLICTGQLINKRNPEYAEKLVKYISDNGLEDEIKIIGLISREEQLKLINMSVALIQPSLFEGWGTSVEDAKTLGKRIIMSDIAVHYEQKNDDCFIFERLSPTDLARVMLQVWNDHDYVCHTKYDYRKQAAIYGESFYNIIMTF